MHGGKGRKSEISIPVKVLNDISPTKGINGRRAVEKGPVPGEDLRPGIEEDFSFRIQDRQIPIRILNNGIKILDVGDKESTECPNQIGISRLSVAGVVGAPDSVHIPTPGVVEGGEAELIIGGLLNQIIKFSIPLKKKKRRTFLGRPYRF